jgi:hypothetical protein
MMASGWARRCKQIQSRRANLSEANNRADDGWTKHTDHHWSRIINGKRLDYWPSTCKWQYDGKKYAYHSGNPSFINYGGMVEKFIAEIESPMNKERP